ncbi:MAG: recombinase family protein [Clostridia bacterium]|nr:recombinase family protein [Clostridia bacterium]
MLTGKTYSFIAKYLTELKIPTPHKKEVWRPKAVQSILTNEKYKGSAILQKTFTVDFLQKKVKKNEGEVAKYYVEKSHPAIISPEEWEKVQTEVEYRKLRGNHYNSLNPFCFKIVCGECGDHYGKKVWHSTDPKYRKSVWHCNSKYLRETGCSTPFITDEDIKTLFIRAVRKLSVDDGTVLETCMLAKETLADASAEEEKGRGLADKLEMLNLMITNLIKENAAEPMDQTEYNRKYNLLSGQYEEAQFEYNSLCEKILEKRSKADRIDTFIEQIKSMQNMPLVYSDKMFINMVDEIKVTADESLIFKFKNGAEIEELLD